MKLTLRFLLAFIAALALALGVTTWLTIARESEQFDRDLRTESLLVGTLVGRAHDLATRAGDPAAADESIVAANTIPSGFAVRRVALGDVPAAHRVAVSAGQAVMIRDDDARPDGRLDTFVPLRTDAAPSVLQVTASLRGERQHIHQTTRRAIVSSVAALVLAATAVSALGVVLIARPTRALIAKTRRVGRGDFDGPLQIRQRDELGDLAAAVNAMSDELAKAVAQLRHADRLMTVGRLSAGIAHELGTPLNVIEGRAKMIQQGEVEGDEVADSARIVVEQSRRITGIVRQLLDFARRGERARGPVDLVAIATQTERLLASTARKASVELAGPTRSAPLRALGDEAQLLQVVTNLVVNAIQATPEGGRVAIDVRDAGARVVLEVSDTGSGMDAATRERVFEPFFTTKDVGAGTGLGLSVVHGIVHDHGGTVEVESAPGRGSRFAVFLPRPEQA